MKIRRVATLVSVAAFALLSASCTPATQTQLVIRIDGMNIPANGLGMRITVRRMGAMTPMVDRMVMDPRFPLELGIVAADPADARRVEIELRATARDLGMLIQRASANFVPNRVMYVTLGFTAACTVARDEECRRQDLACRSDGQCSPTTVPMSEIWADGGPPMMRMEPPFRSDAAVRNDVSDVSDVSERNDGNDGDAGSGQDASDTEMFDAPMSDVSDVQDATLMDDAAVSDGDI